LIKVDSDWERAVEAALGADVQAIVVNSWESAQRVREHLGDGLAACRCCHWRDSSATDTLVDGSSTAQRIALCN
jgi:hypothetical protein